MIFLLENEEANSNKLISLLNTFIFQIEINEFSYSVLHGHKKLSAKKIFLYKLGVNISYFSN